MGQYAIKMPDIGEGIAEVELVEWRVQPGDAVHEDQVVADVMTDKATVEIPSPVAGTVLTLGGQPGQLLAVGAELIRLEVEGAGNVGAQAGAAPVAEVTRQDAPAAPPTAPAVSASEPPIAPPPPAPAAPSPVASAPTPTAATAAPRAPGEKPLASPAVRQRAWDLGVALQFVPGSGPGSTYVA